MRHRRGPLDDDKPKGRQITLAQARLPASDELIGATLNVLDDPPAWPEWAGILQQLWELTDPAAAAAGLRACGRAGPARPSGSRRCSGGCWPAGHRRPLSFTGRRLIPCLAP